jgi:hypothetical protein
LQQPLGQRHAATQLGQRGVGHQRAVIQQRKPAPGQHRRRRNGQADRELPPGTERLGDGHQRERRHEQNEIRAAQIKQREAGEAECRAALPPHGEAAGARRDNGQFQDRRERRFESGCAEIEIGFRQQQGHACRQARPAGASEPHEDKPQG